MTATAFDAAAHPRAAASGQFVVAPRHEADVALGVPALDPAADPYSDACNLPPAQLLGALYERARADMDAHGLHEWKLGYVDHRGKVLGTTTHASRTIALSAAHMVTIGAAERRDTVLHEIAHALMPSHEGHGWRWQAKAREIGASPTRTTDAEQALEESAKVIGTCPMGHTYGRSRMPTKRYACGKPGHPAGQPSSERVLTWARNTTNGGLDAAVKAAVAQHPAVERGPALAVGTRVRLAIANHHLAGAHATVTSKGRTNAVVRVDGYSRQVRIPFSMLEALED